MSWRDEFYKKIQKEKLGQSMKKQDDVINFIKEEFTKFVEPIQEDSSFEEYNGYYTFSILNKDLEIKKEKNKLIFSKSMESPSSNEALLKFNEFTLVDGIYCAVIDNHPVKIDESIVDLLFKKAFFLQD